MLLSLDRFPDYIDPAHPLLRQEYAVFTPPIEELVGTIADWIDQQTTGAYIYGPSRYGKSTAVQRFLRTMLNERFGREIPLVIWEHPSTGNNLTEIRFWRELLRLLGHPVEERRKSSDGYRAQVVSCLRAEAIRTNVNYVVIVIDEAQDLSDNELKWLLTVQNELAFLHSTRMSVIQIGSHQMGYIFSSLVLTENRHLAARFYAADAQFHGLRNADEIKFALQGYDEDSEWPEESKMSYTAYFARDAFARGFRLADSASLLWDAMVNKLPTTIKSVREFPMKYLALSAEHALKEIGRGVKTEEATSSAAWQRSLDRLDFGKYMRIVIDKYRPTRA